jgi:hypothetical protein
MAHFLKPPQSPPDPYDVDGRLAPDSVWRMRVAFPGSGQIALWGGHGLWVRSTRQDIVTDAGISRSEDRDLTFLKFLTLRSGDFQIQTGLGVDVWVTLEVEAGGSAKPDGNLNNATQSGIYQNIDAKAVVRSFHGGHPGIELLGGLSRGYMRWIEVTDGHTRESSGPPPAAKPTEVSLPWITYANRPNVLVVRQGWTFRPAGNVPLRDYILEVWWLAADDTEYQVLESHSKRAGYGDWLGYSAIIRPFCGDLALEHQMKIEFAAAIVGLATMLVSAAAWRYSIRNRSMQSSMPLPPEASAALQRSPPSKPGIRVLLVGPETEAEFQYAQKVNAGGGKATAINPVRTPAADQFAAGGGEFVQGKIEALPGTAKFDIIREDFPYPTGNFVDIPAANQRISRLNPGGSWVVITEKADFADSLEAAAKVQGAQVMRRDLAIAHEATPVSTHPVDQSRIALIITRN